MESKGLLRDFIFYSRLSAFFLFLPVLLIPQMTQCTLRASDEGRPCMARSMWLSLLLCRCMAKLASLHRVNFGICVIRLRQWHDLVRMRATYICTYGES